MKQNAFSSRDLDLPDEPKNLLEPLPDRRDEEFFETLLRLPGVRFERIVSSGQATPAGEWYDQAWDEWVLVLKGSARLTVAGRDEPHRLEAGDSLLIPAGRRHRVEWTAPEEPTVWLAVHVGEPSP